MNSRVCCATVALFLFFVSALHLQRSTASQVRDGVVPIDAMPPGGNCWYGVGTGPGVHVTGGVHVSPADAMADVVAACGGNCFSYSLFSAQCPDAMTPPATLPITDENYGESILQR